MSTKLRFYLRLFVGAHIAIAVIIALYASGPIIYNDYPNILYLQHRAVQFFSQSWNLWGYDPFFASGYPLDFVWNNALDLQFLSTLLYPLPQVFVMRYMLAAYLTIGPLVFWHALGNFGMKDSSRRLAVILLIAYWGTGMLSWLTLIGMPSAILVFILSFLAVSFFYRYLIEKDSRAIPWMYALTPFCFMAHKTAVVLIGLPVAVMLVAGLRKISSRQILHVALVAALVLLVNSFWLVPFMHVIKYKITIAEAPHWLDFDPLRIFREYFTLSKTMGNKTVEPESGNFIIKLMLLQNTLLRDAFLGLGIYGMIQWRRNGLRLKSAFFMILIPVLLVLIYFGSFWGPSALLNPIRYLVLLDFLLVLPAVFGVETIWKRLAYRRAGKSKPALIRAVGIASIPVFTFVFLLSAFVYFHFLFEIQTKLDGDTRALAVFLNKTPTEGGRIMLEDSGWNDRDGEPPKYSHSQFPALLSDLTGKEFIGGPYPYLFIAHIYAEFHDGKFLGGKPVGGFSDASMAAELQRYNINTIVCWSADCKSYFSRKPGIFDRLGTIGRFKVYRWRDFHYNPFIEGRGYVLADQSGIRCYRVRTESKRVVLKYHYFEEFAVKGAADAVRFRSGEDPVGFIRIDGPKEYFTIINKYYGKRRQ